MFKNQVTWNDKHLLPYIISEGQETRSDLAGCFWLGACPRSTVEPFSWGCSQPARCLSGAGGSAFKLKSQFLAACCLEALVPCYESLYRASFHRTAHKRRPCFLQKQWSKKERIQDGSHSLLYLNLRSDMPSLLLYFIGYTDWPWNRIRRELHEGVNTIRQGSLGATFRSATTGTMGWNTWKLHLSGGL